MGGMMRWAIQEAVLRNEFKVYSNESNGTEPESAYKPEEPVYYGGPLA